MAIDDGTIQSASRALSLLEFICVAPAPISARAAAEHLGVALPSVYHLLKTLEVDGYIHRRGSEGFAATGKVAELAAVWQSHIAPDRRALGLMHELAARTGETVYISGWIGGDVCVEAFAEGTHAVRVAGVYVGLRGHAYARASGRVLLAFGPPHRRRQYLDSTALEALTPATLIDRIALEAELDHIVAVGYAIDLSGFAAGVGCVSMPLQGQDVSRAITVSAPESRLVDNQERILDAMFEVLGSTRLSDPPSHRSVPSPSGAGRHPTSQRD
jgi:IclR family acetate operon transcriptional repressor